ncbi:MAG: hypothetical protein ACLU9S_21450 [Oscillospiraceae bacterium]
MFETANNLSVQISSFEDLAIVSTSGTISSYLSGYSYSIFPYLSDNEIFSADNVSRGFLFFTDEEDLLPLRLVSLLLPLQDFVIGSTTTSQKTATAFFSCLIWIRCPAICARRNRRIPAASFCMKAYRSAASKRRRKAILPPKSKDCLKNAPPV